MIYIVSDPGKYEAQRKAGHMVLPQEHAVRTADGLEKDGHGPSFKRLIQSETGPCIVLGFGPSRTRLPKEPGCKVYGINRAAIYHKVDLWIAHDIDAVMDCWQQVPREIPLLTYACHWLKPEFKPVIESGRKIIWEDVFPDPTRHGRRPLYWNATTLGLALDLVVRIGHSPIYTLGTDLSLGGYVNPHFTEDELRFEHEMVYKKTCHMFSKEEFPKWNPENVPVIDLSGGRMPCEHRELTEVFRAA